MLVARQKTNFDAALHGLLLLIGDACFQEAAEVSPMTEMGAEPTFANDSV